MIWNVICGRRLETECIQNNIDFVMHNKRDCYEVCRSAIICKLITNSSGLNGHSKGSGVL